MSCVFGKIKPAFNTTETDAQLRAGLVSFALPAGVDAAGLVDSLTLYLAELHKWNQAYNLTAVRDAADMVPRHIFDSLIAARFINGHFVADVGTGAGLPGIPLALCFPAVHFTLLDSNGKKTRFVQHAVSRLGLTNVKVEKTRIENYLPDQLFDVVISRAFASLQDFVAGCAHILSPGGQLIAMKGRYPEDEVATLAEKRPDWRLTESQKVEVPELIGERHILILEHSPS